ncbi:MAG: O-antigen ligase family protein [Patescibacteria group bacterium]
MDQILQKLSLGWTSNKWMLVFGNMLVGVLLIVLANTRLLPLSDVNFIFLSAVIFLMALYRPGWIFLFCVGMLPFENFSLAPINFGFEIRPYQLLAITLSLALVIRFFLRTLDIQFFRLRWFDWALLLIPVGGFLAAFFGPDPGGALKQVAILLSFGLLYLLVRFYVRRFEDISQMLPFLLGSSLVVFGYALWQNMRFFLHQSTFTVMEGRPNATFSEADWLGAYCLFVGALLFMLFFSFLEKSLKEKKSVMQIFAKATPWFLIGFQVLTAVVLVIALSRSAWLGALLGGSVIFVTLFLKEKIRQTNFIQSAILLGVSVLSFGLGIFLTVLFHLTPFPLLDRAQSTTNALQEITVSCSKETVLPSSIENMESLSSFDCRHIRLEEIDAEQALGRSVQKVDRPDPNVQIRAEIYGKTKEVIREHFLFGIGWGNISQFLGTDERGAGLNASNMFLEVWLGSGLIGLIAFTIFWVALFGRALFQFFAGQENRALPLLVMIWWLFLSVFNLFNSGMLLGFFFLVLGVGAALLEDMRFPKGVTLFQKKNV